ncbi:hypothetical protein GOP47_0000347 [Adiantum capillus-veneris]|uniref:Purple acid phosphatase n=1 Tax=Adiantum capillus-veneris TaxID=13818 RepID=A0A9D4VDD5_ADICA|nr:hypothetical protein GOP47_0000347 [Adiantum capillus-veneris]
MPHGPCSYVCDGFPSCRTYSPSSFAEPEAMPSYQSVVKHSCKLRTFGIIWMLLGLAIGPCNSYIGHHRRAFHNDQPLSKIAMHRLSYENDSSVSIDVSPTLLGSQGGNVDFVTVQFKRPSGASISDWIGVFSPADFNSSLCTADTLGTNRDYPPYLCTAPIKYQFANFTTSNYVELGEGSLTFRIINQRADFSFAFFTGGLDEPVLLAVSSSVISFVNPKAPSYPRLAFTSKTSEISVTWTSGYSQNEAIPVVKWGEIDATAETVSVAQTLSFERSDMCGSPARSVGWRDPGYIHTAFLGGLWPSYTYYYTVGHKLQNGSYIWEQTRNFTGAPFPGEDSLQQVVIFGDMGKGERDLSNEYNNFQPGALNTTDRLVEDLDNIDLIFHIGDLCYANGYLSQWDQFTEQIEPLASHVPYMVASGNHERDWPGSGSFYLNTDSGGECGVLAQTMFNMPLKNREKFWYSLDYGLFHFCIADSEHDWQEGSEQYKFIEECLASADRLKQPWLIFAAHRVLGYSSDKYYAKEGTFAEPMARESLQKLWQKYKVDLAFFGHVHNYERTCPVYENSCISTEASYYTGVFNATIHVVVGGAGASLSEYTDVQTSWSFSKDMDHGFGKLTSYNRSTLFFEYKRSSNSEVYDSFLIKREYIDVLGCDSINNCPPFTLAT